MGASSLAASPVPVPEQELKLVGDRRRVASVERWLRHVARPDPEFPVGRVSSLYYDTRDLAMLREKIHGHHHKTKVRLRWYAPSDTAGSARHDLAFMEVKRREGPTRRKVRIATELTTSEIDDMDLDAPQLRAVPDRLRRAGECLPAGLVPVLVVHYERLRFIDRSTGARVSLDRAIRVGSVNRRVLPVVTAKPLDVLVVEVKGPDLDVPRSLYRLYDLGCRRWSFSKYGACCASVGVGLG